MDVQYRWVVEVNVLWLGLAVRLEWRLFLEVMERGEDDCGGNVDGELPGGCAVAFACVSFCTVDFGTKSGIEKIMMYVENVARLVINKVK